MTEDEALSPEHELRRRIDHLEGKMRALRAIHTPVEVRSIGKCCKASHGPAWKRWPCAEFEILDMDEDLQRLMFALEEPPCLADVPPDFGQRTA
jgi:hypothetical protein